jgi:DNA-binding CsgD family transcriptional regulator
LLHNLGYLALRGGDLSRAARLFGESLALFQGQGDRRGIAECLAGLAGLAGALKQPERGARLLGAAEALFEAAGATVWPASAADYARSLAFVRGQLDEPAFATAWAAGRSLSPEQATAEALAVASPSHEISGMNGLGLTPREREVAVLVARGLTNRQIGAVLFITEGTARLHVKHILRSLGFASRAQIAAWAVARGLVAAPEPA